MYPVRTMQKGVSDSSYICQIGKYAAALTIHTCRSCFIHCKNSVFGGLSLKDYIEERAVEIANYIIETKATVRQTAKTVSYTHLRAHET